MTLPDPKVFGATCARGTASLILRIPQYLVYFALVLAATRAAYPTYGWRTSLRDSAVGFVIFVLVGLVERRARAALYARWTTPIERRAVGWVAGCLIARRRRRASRIP